MDIVPTQLSAMNDFFGPSAGQGWQEIGNLTAAFILCSLIGLEREMHRKSAGLRTHALVGLGAALFMLVSKFGFLDIIAPQVAFDPSRMAAQIVSGIGFIGAGLIFVRRDSVRGLTTAAVVWVTAAVGAACGSGLIVLGIAVTIAHFIAVVGFPIVVRHLPGLSMRQSPLFVRYLDGQAVLRRVLAATTSQGFSVAEVFTKHTQAATDGDLRPAVDLELYVEGRGPVENLVAALVEINGVLDVRLSAGED